MKKRGKKLNEESILRDLENLTMGEKEIITRMVSQNTNTHYASIECQYTNGLVGKKILNKCFNDYEILHPMVKNTYKMQSFVWEKVKNDPRFK